MKPNKSGVWEWFEEDGTKRLVHVCDVGVPIGEQWLRVYWWGGYYSVHESIEDTYKRLPDGKWVVDHKDVHYEAEWPDRWGKYVGPPESVLNDQLYQAPTADQMEEMRHTKQVTWNIYPDSSLLSKNMKMAFQLVLIVILSFLFYLFLTREAYLNVLISGQSMEPTFHDGGRLSASKLPFWWRNPRKGDVVLIREYYGINMGDGLIDIKRVAAVSGDTVTNKNGVIIIPKDQYYVLGDNAAVSFDSRFYGPLHKDQVLAIVNQ